MAKREMMRSAADSEESKKKIKCGEVEAEDEDEEEEGDQIKTTLSQSEMMLSIPLPPAAEVVNENKRPVVCSPKPTPPPKHSKVKASDFDVIRLLGKGAVGKVYLVRHLYTGEPYAMKVVQKEDILRRNKIHRLQTEWNVLCQYDHPFVARLYSCFQSSSKLYFVMEYCAGGEFFRFLQKQQGGRLEESAARFYAAEVLLALEFLHANGFVYRDVKPENILMTAEGHVLLTDFDLSKKTAAEPQIVISSAATTSKAKSRTSPQQRSIGQISTPPTAEGFSSFVGTPEYIAPEIIRDSGHNYGVDWWGFGILIYEMLYGTTPFKGGSQRETLRKISEGKKVTFPCRPCVSDSAKSLMKALLNPKPSERLGVRSGSVEVKNHKWFRGVSFAMIRNTTPPLKPIIAPDALVRRLSSPTSITNSEGILSDGDPDDFPRSEKFKQLMSKQHQRHDNTKRQTPYNHPAMSLIDPFSKMHYFESSKSNGARKYASPITPPPGSAPTPGCTGFGSGSKNEEVAHSDQVPPPPLLAGNGGGSGSSGGTSSDEVKEQTEVPNSTTPPLKTRLAGRIKTALFRQPSASTLSK
eukprot:TRINITY_DN3811_c0_g1_i1.p1 TRINITY_DN3811_c0_g1~~TRINITY_DN3811_c0_g1_i1.p1  ORF type:complete len:581 (+),score=113.51 TRINITY_DN3811_c0_g1_i1:54-1796(+)